METNGCTVKTTMQFNDTFPRADCLPRLILKAARTGNVQLLTYCDTKFRAPLNLTDTGGETLAHLGASNGHFNVVEWCLKRENHYFVNAVDRFDNTLLHAAATGGSVDVFDYVAQEGWALLHLTNKAGFTALHEAAAHGHKEVVANLVQRWKVSPNQTTLSGNYTAALLAAKHRRAPVLLWLLAWDPSLAHAVAECDYNLLHWAAYNRLRNVTALLCDKYDVQYRDNCDGDFPMHVAYRMGSFRTADVLADVCYKRELDRRTIAPRDTVAHEAARLGHLQALKHLTSRNIPYNMAVNDLDQSPTMLAAENFRFATIRYLLKRDPGLYFVDKNGNTVLHYTACNPYLSIVKYILKNRESERNSLGLTNHAGESGIYKAATCGNLPFIAYLVEAGADINIPTNENRTALTVAVESENLEIVKYLIRKGANTKLMDKDGFRQSLNNATNEEMKKFVELHLPELATNGTRSTTESSGGKPVNATPKSTEGPDIFVLGNCSAQEVATRGDLNYVKSCHFRRFRGFIQLPKNWIESVAHRSAVQGHFEIVQWLLENEEGLVEPRGGTSNTILHAAAQGGSVELVDLVATKNVSLLNQKNAAGFSALHLAVASGHKPVVVRLVERWKMWPNDTTTFTNNTAVLIAAKHNRNQILEWLLETDPSLAHAVGECNNNLLHWTSARGDTPMVDLLCRKYEVRSVSNCDGDFPIHFAFRNSSYGLADVLHETCHANLLQPRWQFPNNTAAHDAARIGNLDILQYLDAKNMTRNYTDFRNNLRQTPVFLAIETNQVEVVYFLVDVNNADLQWTDKNGDTILHMLAGNKDLRILQYLEEVRPDDVKLFLNWGNGANETPLYKATMFGNVPLVRYLVTFLGAYTLMPAKDRTAPLLVAVEKEDHEMVELLSRNGYMKRVVDDSELEAWQYARTEKFKEFIQKNLLCPASPENAPPLMIDGHVTVERERRMVRQSDYPGVGSSSNSIATSSLETGISINTVVLLDTLIRKIFGWRCDPGPRTGRLPLSPRDLLASRIDPLAIESVYRDDFFEELDDASDHDE